MSANSLRAGYWHWAPFVLGAVLLLPAYILAVTAPRDNSFAFPGPGKTTLVEVANGHATNQFVLGYSVIVDPAKTVHMPDRPPIPCRIRLVATQSEKRIAEFEQLHYAAESFAGHEAEFDSDLFEMPTGKTWVTVTNEGCRNDYVWVGGMGGIGRIREGLLVPIGAEILKWLGLISIAVGLVAGLIGYVIARARPHSEAITP